MTHIDQDSIFYHIYPLGACGAPHQNDFQSEPQPRLRQIPGWLDHIQSLGANAIYLGPVFESSTHGYDTADYYQVDRRLGTRADLSALSHEMHERGMSLVLDGVFNHVGRNFWAFRDLLERGWNSPYKDWFAGLNFEQRSPYGDPFSYQAWNGHFDLIKLNLANLAVQEHLFNAIAMWKEEFQIDGIRLDAADSLSFDFMRALRDFSNKLDPDLWLMGEVIHGDYRNWANPKMLHATTNYELYKSLYSSFNDGNFFELAHSLNRQFGQSGIYSHLNTLYHFADNHDVSRIASQLNDQSHLYPLYALLFSLPGLPSVYYGSEFGFEAHKQSDDWNLRPDFDLPPLQKEQHGKDLRAWISRLASIRQNSAALKYGGYQTLHTAPKQLAFLRTAGDNRVIVLVNSATEEVQIDLQLPGMGGWRFTDQLNNGQTYISQSDGQLKLSLFPRTALFLLVTEYR